METQTQINAYQDLFDYIADKFEVNLTQDEMDEIISLCFRTVELYNLESNELYTLKNT